MGATEETIATVKDMAGKYEAGFVTDIESDKAPKGLNEDIVRFISAKKKEPEWLLERRLKAFAHWQRMKEPKWAKLEFPELDYQDAYYYSAPKSAGDGPKSLDEVDPKLLETYKKLGIPLREQEILAGVKGRTPVAVDAVFDSVSVATTFKDELKRHGVIFCSISEAVREHPELVKKYLSSVVPYSDNKHACLNTAVFTDGSFVYIPPGVRCPMELSTYFRINELNTGQFERTLIIADEGSQIHYVEGCTAPVYSSDSLHSAVVEIIVKKNARVRYTTIQNWSNNVFNLVTKRAAAYENAVMEWVDGNLGSKLTTKFPSVYLMEPGAHAEILSLAFAGNGQHQDAGGKVIHAASNTTSTIISKSLSKDGGRTSYRGLLKVYEGCENVKANVRCDALLLDEDSRSDTYPTMEIDSPDVSIQHEAYVSKLGEDQLFYLMSRGMSEEAAAKMIVNGFVEPIVKELPMEYAVELNRLIELQMEGAVG